MNENPTIRLKAVVLDANWVLTEETFADGRLVARTARAFASRSELEVELGDRYVSNLNQQRLLDGEPVTLWQ